MLQYGEGLRSSPVDQARPASEDSLMHRHCYDARGYTPFENLFLSRHDGRSVLFQPQGRSKEFIQPVIDTDQLQASAAMNGMRYQPAGVT